MANIKKLIEFRDKITNAINVLIRLDSEYYALPELGTLQDTLTELEKDCQPADVIIDIVADNDYLQYKNLYAIHLQPLFKCSFGVGCAIVDGVKYDWWDGLNNRLECQGYNENEIMEYTEVTNKITSFARKSLRGLKKDLESVGLIVDCSGDIGFPDNEECAKGEGGNGLDADDMLLRRIFRKHLTDFLSEARKCKKGSDVARLVNWYVREYNLRENLEKKGDLNKPLWEALQTKGIETASISTWNNTIK